MKRFKIPVRQMVDGNLVLVEVHEAEAENFQVAAKIIALGSYDGRDRYTPEDNRPFVSSEGWSIVTNSAGIHNFDGLRPYLWLAEQITFNGITSERLSRICTFKPGKTTAHINQAVKNATERYQKEEGTLQLILADELSMVLVLNESYILNPTSA